MASLAQIHLRRGERNWCFTAGEQEGGEVTPATDQTPTVALLSTLGSRTIRAASMGLLGVSFPSISKGLLQVQKICKKEKITPSLLRSQDPPSPPPRPEDISVGVK